MAKHERFGSLQFSKQRNNNSLDVPLGITMKSRDQFLRLVAVLLISLNAVVALATQEHEPSAFVPPIDEYDWIQLTSDEWLKGELISLYDGELTFESDNLGRLTIDWEDVRILRSHGSLSVKAHGLNPLSGKLLVDDPHCQPG